jgi:hypothetical protein
MRLHPFFSYFGSKYRLATLYKKPEHDIIIEPFCGSSGYSLLYPDRKVFLYDSYDLIVNLWDYLINVSEEEVLALPLGPFSKENPIDKENIAIEAKTLIGFWLTESQTSASRYPLSRSRGGNWTINKRKMIANQLKYIRHWKVEQKSYEQIDNKPSTWFIDPPYQNAGKRYKYNKINYNHLSQWVYDRNGQVIVCEQEGANWMNFKELKLCQNASNQKYKEVVYYQ